MTTVNLISIVNKSLESTSSTAQFPDISCALNADYVSLPALAVSPATLILVSLLTPHSPENVWKPFIDRDESVSEQG